MTKEKKENPYLFCRKKRNLTRDKLNEMIGISSDRLGDIEKNERNAEPEDIVNLSKCYEMPRLCQYYCSHECEVGKMIGYPEIDLHDSENLAKIALEILYCLKPIQNIDTDKLIEISRDAKISPDQIQDFKTIKETLEPLSKFYNALVLWEKEDQAEKNWEKDKTL